jgi:hypothetical protein
MTDEEKLNAAGFYHWRNGKYTKDIGWASAWLYPPGVSVADRARTGEKRRMWNIYWPTRDIDRHNFDEYYETLDAMLASLKLRGFL